MIVEPTGPPITLKLGKRVSRLKDGRYRSACVWRKDPNTIWLYPDPFFHQALNHHRGPGTLAEAAERGLREFVTLLNHESLHAAMLRAGIRWWLAIDRYYCKFDNEKTDVPLGLCYPTHVGQWH